MYNNILSNLHCLFAHYCCALTEKLAARFALALAAWTARRTDTQTECREVAMLIRWEAGSWKVRTRQFCRLGPIGFLLGQKLLVNPSARDSSRVGRQHISQPYHMRRPLTVAPVPHTLGVVQINIALSILDEAGRI